MNNRKVFFLSIIFITFFSTYSTIIASEVLWSFTRECEFPDAYTVGNMIFRGNASNVRTHGQFGSEQGYAEYTGIETPQNYNLKIRLRYSKHSPSTVPIYIKIDNEDPVSFVPSDMGSWNTFTTSPEIDLGNIDKGVHTIRLYADEQTWGVADLDYIQLAGYTPRDSLPLTGAILPLILKDKSRWLVEKNDQVLEISYGKKESYPQVAALHLDSGYFRMVYSEDAVWGTSVVIPPAFWKDGYYYQGATITATWETKGNLLVLNLQGNRAGLSFTSVVTIHPPTGQLITANVATTTSGNINLDDRPNEAFKPVMLSSMHVSDSIWDTNSAFIGADTFSIPTEGWLTPVMTSNIFGLTGGTSDWKKNSPTVEVILDRLLSTAGWVTPSSNPNDDNVGFWAATSTVLSSWQYTLHVKP